MGVQACAQAYAQTCVWKCTYAHYCTYTHDERTHMGRDMCHTDICIYMCIDMGTSICMCVDTSVGRWIDLRVDMMRQVCTHAYGHRMDMCADTRVEMRVENETGAWTCV